MRWPWVALALAGCAARDSVDLPDLPAEIQTRLLVLRPKDGSTEIVRGPELADMQFRYQQPKADPTEVLYLGWRCADLADLGLDLFQTSLGPLRETSSGPLDIAPPDVVYRATAEDGALPELLLATPTADLLGPELYVTRETPCQILESSQLEVYVQDVFTTLAVTVSPTEALVGSPTTGLSQIDAQGRVEPFPITTPTTAPPLGRAVVAGQRLWLYGDRGSLWSGSVRGGEFEVHPPNPAWRNCAVDVNLEQGGGRFYDLDARVVDGATELVVGSDDASIARYSEETRTWTVLREPVEIPGRRECPASYASVSFLDGGGVIGVHGLLDGIYVASSDGIETFEQLGDGQAATKVARVDGFGTLLGTAQSRLFRRLGPNRYEELGPRAPGTGYVRFILNFGEGIFYGGGGGIFQQYYPDYGMCIRGSLPDLGGGRAVARLGPGFLDVPNLTAGRRPVYNMQPRPRRDCEPFAR
ncbi:MAG: hypothetical protein HY791_05435 [Deltaproteobacteria bacterium]|nr:hypothetical protein [Deltaproteobacteria bacterium]